MSGEFASVAEDELAVTPAVPVRGRSFPWHRAATAQRWPRAALGALRSAAALRVAALALPACAVLGALAVGYEGVRLAQMLVLALPGLLWLGWPRPSRAARTVQAMLCFLLGAAFIADGAVRGFLLDAYQAVPDSAMVLGAVANTTDQESSEFFSMYWREMLGWAGFGLAGAGALGTGMWLWWRVALPGRSLRGWKLALALVVALLVLASLAVKPWRRHHPLLFWSGWAAQVADLRGQWNDFDDQRNQLLARAAALAPTLGAGSPDTVVLIIGESVNRAELGVYGYARETTPQLSARKQELGDALQVFRHAWSVDASTVPALRNLFYFGQPASSERMHLLALARAAGYQTWWIGNQDDLAISQEHARLADHVSMLNQVPGRSGRSLDGVVVPALRAALADPAPRKLVIVHLLGLHPHYRLRHPAGEDPFAGADDQVSAQLAAAGRPLWIRELRNEYDSAVRYHDGVVAQTLDLSRKAAGDTVWMYLSDHGQEVGHSTNHAGHSASTADGYRIPLMLWRSSVSGPSALAGEAPVRSDWLGNSITSMMGIEWQGVRPERDVLGERYRWQAPELPAAIDFGS